MWQAWVTLLIGLWMILSAFVPGLLVAGNFIVAGAALAIFGFWSAGWQGVINGLLGLWIVLSGIVPHLVAPGNFIVIGIIVAVLSLWRTAGTREPTTAP